MSIPITDKKIKLGFGLEEGYFDNFAIVNTNWAEPATGLLEVDGGEVEEAAYLVLGLENISPVFTGPDRAVGPGKPILP